MNRRVHCFATFKNEPMLSWTTGVGDARARRSGKWEANLKKAKDGPCHVTGVAVRSGDNWLKAINPDFEIK